MPETDRLHDGRDARVRHDEVGLVHEVGESDRRQPAVPPDRLRRRTGRRVAVLDHELLAGLPQGQRDPDRALERLVMRAEGADDQ